jgi:hypothetical protein
MIRLNPRDRLTIPQILAHHWLKETNEDDSEDEDEQPMNEGGDNSSAVVGGVEHNKGVQ